MDFEGPLADRVFPPSVDGHERPISEAGSGDVVRPFGEQHRLRTGRRRQVDFDIASSLRHQSDFRLENNRDFVKMCNLTVFQYQIEVLCSEELELKT